MKEQDQGEGQANPYITEMSVEWFFCNGARGLFF
jgi:hypothetical protein